ncbi:hypothetical protein ONS95_000719 [Cadophora gregata]|uniref:uncharacterized protein n=1 Tax=Cadophora gregata TaxID=51156 RepID=UPI0026DC417C|nr:uncharacterized protein ONS95_000719 [Cadophora gregata]KAK0103105.1 hypothetical protein ONS96_005714 [Cadophora gregata f. sp. sojae]KAK0128768.1 hypothetical protein ONS95_000719 [Cadophora gregata]
MTIPVFKVKYELSIRDPFMSQPRHHTVLFLPFPKHSSGSGTIHHVVGDLVSGMSYATRSEEDPESIQTFYSKELIGHVKQDNYPAMFEDVLSKLDPPPKQRKFRVETMRIEQCKPDGSWYEEGEEKDRMWKCSEWIEEKAVPALIDAGLLK